MARIKMLEERAAMLAQFLTAARTQTPLFEDARTADAGSGIVVGPAVVRLDFLGSAIVRATVRNASRSRASPLLTVHMRCADATVVLASVAVGSLEAGQARVVELLGLARAKPVALSWSASNL